MNDLKEFPGMVADFGRQLLHYTLTEVETFLLALVAVLVGLKKGLIAGLLAFFFPYWVVRMVGGYVSLIANKLHLIGAVMNRQKGDNE